MISDGTRACFNGLCDRLREELQRNLRVHDALSVELQEAVTLYYMHLTWT